MVEHLDAHLIEKVPLHQKIGSDEVQTVFTRYPHRINDNFHWYCSTCGSVVSKNKTQLHLITCLMKLSNFSKDDEEFTENASSSREELLKIVNRSMQSSATLKNSKERNDEELLRPRTKRLERPTPNIKHPIISSTNKYVANKSKSLQKHCNGSVLKINGKSCVDSKKTKTMEKIIDCREDKQKPLNMQPNKPVIKKFVKRLELSHPCKSCTIGSEKFHSHSFNAFKIKNCNSANAESSFDHLRTNGETESNLNEEKINTSLLKCYICENEFDTKTLPSHEPSCLEKWKQTNAGLPADQRLPQKQKRRESLTTGTGCDPAGWEHFKAQLCPCKICGRTFFPHRLAIHEKACKVSEETKTEPPKTQKRASFSVSRSRYVGIGETNQCNDSEWQVHLKKLEPCDRCGRTFFPHRLRVHQPNCKAKPVADSLSSPNHV